MSDPRASGFFFDPAEEEAAAILAMQTVLPGQHPAGSTNASTAQVGSGSSVGSASADTTVPFRPLHRPPMALLCVMHDGDQGGEIIPLRADQYVIARLEGDIRIPNDLQISKKQHAELSRVPNDSGGYRWQLADLGSTNGTFVQVDRLFLHPGTEVLIGRTRYRFEPAVQAQAPATHPAVESLMTVRPGTTPVVRTVGDVRSPDPTLLEIAADGEGTKVHLVRNEYWIGRDPNECGIVPNDDPFVSPRHAKVSKDANGRWQIQNNRSLNGLWIRLVKPLGVFKTCRFQLGEQRFLLKVLI